MRRLFETKENRNRWRELQLEKLDRHEDVDLGVVWGTRNRITSRYGTPTMVFDLVLFVGTSSKPAINGFYTSAESREAGIRSVLDGQRRRKTWKAERAEQRKADSAAPNPAKVGDILVCSWGYEQTNVDWYQVVEVKGKNTVVVRRIEANSAVTGFERGNCSPVRDAFLEGKAPRTCRVKKWKDGYTIKIEDYATARYCPEGEKASHFWTSYY